MKRTASAPGKIILSGEYAVVFGYKGIAVPAKLTMDVAYEESAKPLAIDWPGASPEWHAYAKKVAELCGCSTGTIAVRTMLPLGKGMGSSTALVIAMTRCLIGDDRDRALTIEDAMNPGHSGLDFAVIWNNTPTAKNYQLQAAVLIDTGKPNETTPELVAWVRSREATLKEPLAAIGRCTERLLGGESPMTVFPDHHRAQVALGVVPENTQSLIKKIEQLSAVAKVIGAGGRTGGGGMVLAIGSDPDAIVRLAESGRMSVLRL